jgi:hypothetical protein
MTSTKEVQGEAVSDERLARFIQTCRDMGDAGDGKRYEWWDGLANELTELQALRSSIKEVQGEAVSDELHEAALGMKRIVEEIDGAMKHGTWRDEKGMRLKDTPEWVRLYNAISSSSQALRSSTKEVQGEAVSELAMKIAVHMEVHSALSSTTRAKAVEIQSLLNAEAMNLRSSSNIAGEPVAWLETRALPWKYGRLDEAEIDWIEDATGKVFVEHVGHADGPAICAAVNALSIPQNPEAGEPVALDAYDAGLLAYYGGGDVDWWQDYIRAELGRAHDHYEAQFEALRSSSNIAGEPVAADADEAYQIGKREGYADAVQDIDLLTGGDGEYRWCSDGDPERHCPDAAAMKQRILDRFDTLSIQPSSNIAGEPVSDERICFDRAMEQWRASLKRPDLDEEARVKGALAAYQRQAFALSALRSSSNIAGEPVAWRIESKASPNEAWEWIEGREPTEYLGYDDYIVRPVFYAIPQNPEAGISVTDEMVERAETLRMLCGAKDVWTDHGSGFRIHFAFESKQSDRVIERVFTARAALSSTDGGKE